MENVENFLNKWLSKIGISIALYFLMQMSGDFKDVKTTLQQVIVNQATMDQRVTSLEAKTKDNSDDIKDINKTYIMKGSNNTIINKDKDGN